MTATIRPRAMRLRGTRAATAVRGSFGGVTGPLRQLQLGRRHAWEAQRKRSRFAGDFEWSWIRAEVNKSSLNILEAVSDPSSNHDTEFERIRYEPPTPECGNCGSANAGAPSMYQLM